MKLFTFAFAVLVIMTGVMAGCDGDRELESLVKESAPGFTLNGLFRDEVLEYDLASYRGRWLVLFFYPADLTYICPLEVFELKRRIQDFATVDCAVLGISRDTLETHREWIQTDFRGELPFPLLSDRNGQVARRYGVWDEEERVALRATFIIDPEGKIQYQVVHNLEIGRSTAELFRVLAALQTGEYVQPDWEENEPTLGPGPNRADVSRLLESATE